MTANRKLTAQDEQEINDSISDAQPVIEGQEDALATVDPQTSRTIVMPSVGFNIQGLEDVPSNIIPVPFVRLVQGQSKKIVLEDGKTEAPEGTFYFNDNRQCFEKLSFIMLRAKHQIVEFEREENGHMVKKPTKQILILGITTDTEKLFILALSVMSFSNFGRLINEFKTNHITQTWQYEIVATSEKTENDKGKFRVQSYKLGDKLSDEKVESMSQVYGEYGGVLDRDYTKEDMEGTA